MKISRFVSTARLGRLARWFVFTAAVCGCMPAVAQTDAPPVWPDSFLSRLGGIRFDPESQRRDSGSSSATLSLEKWCRDFRLAEDRR